MACKHCEQMQELVGEMGDEIVRLNEQILILENVIDNLKKENKNSGNK